MTDPQALKDRVAQILNQEVAPALHLEGGNLEVLEVAGGVARVRLGEICQACPGTIMAVILCLEQELRRRIPEIEYLEAVP